MVLTANTTDLSEFNSCIRLSRSCSSPSFFWLNSSSEVTANARVQFTDEDATLTIINITRYDQGPFMCYVFNNFSNDISNLVKLSISCELSCLLYSFLNFFSLNYNYYKTLSFLLSCVNYCLIFYIMWFIVNK